MDKVSAVILCGDMRDVQGVNKVTEALILGREIFSKNSINLAYVFAGKTIIDCEDYHQSIIGSNIKDKKYILMRKIVLKLKGSFIYNTYTVQKCLFKRDSKVEKTAVINYLKNKSKADVLLFQNPYIMSIFLNEARKKSYFINERLIIISHHNSKLTENLIKNRPQLASSRIEMQILNADREALTNASSVITLGKEAWDFFRNTYGIDTTIISNGMADRRVKGISKLSTTDQKIHIIAIGAFLYRKGFGYFSEALLMLGAEVRERFVIHLVGDGRDRDAIVKKIEDNNLCDSFEFLGVITQVPYILSQMDVFMLPTQLDTMPIAIIEAMMCGLPIVSTNIGEIPEMIQHGKSGLIIEPNVKSVANALDWLLRNNSCFLQMGHESRKLYEKKFSLNRMINSYSQVINRTIKR